MRDRTAGPHTGAAPLSADRVLADCGQDDGPVVAQRVAAHEQPEVPAARDLVADLVRWGGDLVPEREHLVRWRDVVGRARHQVDRHLECAQIDELSADLQRAADQRVVAEQALMIQR